MCVEKLIGMQLRKSASKREAFAVCVLAFDLKSKQTAAAVAVNDGSKETERENDKKKVTNFRHTSDKCLLHLSTLYALLLCFTLATVQFILPFFLPDL
jgi:hypothetical protein